MAKKTIRKKAKAARGHALKKASPSKKVKKASGSKVKKNSVKKQVTDFLKKIKKASKAKE